MWSPRSLARYLFPPEKRTDHKSSTAGEKLFPDSKPVNSATDIPSKHKLVIPSRPRTRPTPQNVKEQELLQDALNLYPKGLVLSEFIELMSEVAPLPKFFYPLLWNRLVHPWNEFGADRISAREIIQFWKEQLRGHDTTTRLFHVIKRPSNPHILPEDLIPVIRALVQYHPGLSFLQTMPEYREAFVQTALVRILYRANRSKTGKITIREFRNSQLVSVWTEMDRCQDIEKSCKYFSYEHFYVIYCKFWCLDSDHDMRLGFDDLIEYDEASLSSRVVRRVFEHRPCRTIGALFESRTVDGDEGAESEQYLTYCDFVWFILSEVDKTTDTSVEYWFNLIDIDGDGVISAYELEYFWEEQQERGCDARFEDVFYQLNDIVRPVEVGKVRLKDIKKSRHAPLFFDMLISKEKFIALEHEENVHFVHNLLRTKSVWDVFAEQEYALAVAEAEGECSACATQGTDSDSDFFDDPMMDQWQQDTQEYFRLNQRPRSLSSPLGHSSLKTTDGASRGKSGGRKGGKGHKKRRGKSRPSYNTL